MRILGISCLSLWMWGDNKGIPSIFYPQREFARHGHDVHFVCPFKEGERKREEKEGIHIERFDFPFNFRKSIYIQTNTFWNRLKGFLISNCNWFFFQVFGFWYGFRIGKRIRPHIVYAHTLGCAFPAFLLSLVLRSRLVIRVYGVGQLYWLRKNILYRIRKIPDYLAFKIPADEFIITDDGNNGHLLAKEMGVPDYKIKNWCNGIDEEMFHPVPDAKEEDCRKLNISVTAKIIISTCRLVSFYGLTTLMQVLRGVFSRDESVVCIFAGDGPQRTQLENFVRQHKLESQVYFTGVVDRQMIRKLLYASDVFVLLSEFHNCTNTMWEAMASGRCIVTTETESIKKALSSSEDSILVSLSNVKAVEDVICQLLKDKEARDRLGSAAKKRAHELLELWPERAKKELQVLEEIVYKTGT